MIIHYISDTEYTVSGLHIENVLARRYCIFDFEATGPNQEEDHITQIGAKIIEPGGVESGRTFTTLVRSPKRIPEAIERLTGVTNHIMETAPTFSEVYREFADFTKGTVLVTQAGYEFDWPLLYLECQRNGLPPFTNPIIDTKALFTYLYPEVRDIVSTNFLIQWFDIDDKDIKRHDALGDSVLIGRIFVKLLEEVRRRQWNEIQFNEPLQVKRMKLTPLL
ncbi:PolC-type DNA polymerase III [Paenibacillus allorhizosphaerae]|uniref:3'-5' exonuclease DinG n=1 Tax=Paenibacillus allorhizosphaerae TaxID=2849866 RepID=A0ABM8VRY9_9BACL|nr:3'-5' exonuclease [Paenibacillus allorhizosphaerae]CAG7655820.1 3'-5' exonuclease DinG [Paenibacillus allorhizosphaerae]